MDERFLDSKQARAKERELAEGDGGHEVPVNDELPPCQHGTDGLCCLVGVHLAIAIIVRNLEADTE